MYVYIGPWLATWTYMYVHIGPRLATWTYMYVYIGPRLATPSEVARTLIERLASGVSKGVTAHLDFIDLTDMTCLRVCNVRPSDSGGL